MHQQVDLTNKVKNRAGKTSPLKHFHHSTSTPSYHHNVIHKKKNHFNSILSNPLIIIRQIKNFQDDSYDFIYPFFTKTNYKSSNTVYNRA